MESLWLHPQNGEIQVRLDSFKDYPGFLQTMRTRHGGITAEVVTVRWEPYDPLFLGLIITKTEEESKREDDFINEVRRRIAAGENVPPLARLGSYKVFDGRHRAEAANMLDLPLAPVFDAEPLLTKRMGHV